MSLISTLRGKTSDTTTQVARIDTSTHSLQTVEYSHHEIHSGSYYRIHINKDVPNGGTYNVCFTSPDTTSYMHMTFGIDV